jgi:hypothetical protein
MKNSIFLLLSFLISISNLLAQEEEVMTQEVRFVNSSLTTIFIRTIPISMSFNADYRYNLKALHAWQGNQFRFDYINTVYLQNGIKKTFIELPPGVSLGYQFDLVTSNANQGSIGFGKWKIIFSFDQHGFSPIDTFSLEYDALYALDGFQGDIDIFYNSDGSISFKWPECSEINITNVNKVIETWNRCTGYSRAKNLGNFIYDTSESNPYSLIPLDPRRDCGLSGIPEQNHEYGITYYYYYPSEIIRSGNLTLNLTVMKNISTPSTFYNIPWDYYYAREIVILSGVLLKVDPGYTFTMSEYQNTTDAATMIIMGNGMLNLVGSDQIEYFIGSKLILNKNSTLNFKHNSKFYLGRDSELRVKRGGIFCNEGASIKGPGKIIFEAGIHPPVCAALADFIAEDSVKIILEDSAIVELPDDYTLRLKGNTTSLKMHPNSKLVFGENSKLVLEDNANIIAKNAVFESADSTKTWDGIYMSGISVDTISGCKIINASSGINLIEKNDIVPGLFIFHAVIDDCEFINKAGTELQNGIYITSSRNILVSNNSFYAESGSFANAIYMDYCQGDININDNQISNSTNGIVVVQSSPYIARNDLTGSSNSGYGIFLDNSNGIIKFNKIAGHEYSLYSIYSSPFLFRNILSGESDYNIFLTESSVPVMHPVIDGNLTPLVCRR